MSQRPHEAGDRSKSTQWCSTVEMYLFHTSISMALRMPQLRRHTLLYYGSGGVA